MKLYYKLNAILLHFLGYLRNQDYKLNFFSSNCPRYVQQVFIIVYVNNTNTDVATHNFDGPIDTILDNDC